MTNTTFNSQSATRQEVINLIMGIYPNFSEETINALIETTDNIKGVSFVSLIGYSSSKSNNTELKNHTINVGASYAAMLVRDEDKLKAFDITTLDVTKIKWKKLNLNGKTQDEFMASVKQDAALALAEMLAPKTKKDMSHVYRFNKCLSFNTNTNRLCLNGMTIKGTVIVEGEFKTVASSAKTVAKDLIGDQADLSSTKLRTFALDNLMSHIKANGEYLEVYCSE